MEYIKHLEKVDLRDKTFSILGKGEITITTTVVSELRGKSLNQKQSYTKNKYSKNVFIKDLDSF